MSEKGWKDTEKDMPSYHINDSLLRRLHTPHMTDSHRQVVYLYTVYVLHILNRFILFSHDILCVLVLFLGPSPGGIHVLLLSPLFFTMLCVFHIRVFTPPCILTNVSHRICCTIFTSLTPPLTGRAFTANAFALTAICLDCFSRDDRTIQSFLHTNHDFA